MDSDGKIQELNTAIKEALPHMRKVAEDNPFAKVLVRVARFAAGASWVVDKPTAVEDFRWTDLDADGVTDLGKGLDLVASELRIPPMTDRALPPVLVLVSDGQPTDDWESALGRLMALPWGKKAVRIAIAIGQDADLEVLERFIGNKELKPLRANNPETLVKCIRWASTAVLQSASAPPSQSRTEGAAPAEGNVPIPTPPPEASGPATSTDVW